MIRTFGAGPVPARPTSHTARCGQVTVRTSLIAGACAVGRVEVSQPEFSDVGLRIEIGGPDAVLSAVTSSVVAAATISTLTRT